MQLRKSNDVQLLLLIQQWFDINVNNSAYD